MTEPFFDETKLPEAMQIISDADSLMTEKDCENDEAAKKELEELQNKLREVTGKPEILIRDFWRYDEATDLETTAKSALMCTPEKEELTREELIELTEAVMTEYDKYTKRSLKLKESAAVKAKFIKSINHPGGIDLIEDPESFGLPSNPSVYEIVDLAMKGIPE